MPTKKISVRFSPEEFHEIQISARAAGISVSDFLRRALYKSASPAEAVAASIRADLQQGIGTILRRFDAEAEARAALAGEEKDSLVKAVNYLSSQIMGGRK